MKKGILGLLGIIAFGAVTSVFAAKTAGGVAAQVTESLTGIAKLITAGAYVAGMAFMVGAIIKFKAHKDNPTQIPIGTPIALLFVGAALIFIPTVFGVGGQTLFGAGSEVGKISGVTEFST